MRKTIDLSLKAVKATKRPLHMVVRLFVFCFSTLAELFIFLAQLLNMVWLVVAISLSTLIKVGKIPSAWKTTVLLWGLKDVGRSENLRGERIRGIIVMWGYSLPPFVEVGPTAPSLPASLGHRNSSLGIICCMNIHAYPLSTLHDSTYLPIKGLSNNTLLEYETWLSQWLFLWR